MNFLLDANLSPRMVVILGRGDNSVVHVRDVGLLTASDDVILRYAADNQLVVLTADGDFAMLLAVGGLSRPSVVHLRSADHLTPELQATLILNNLAAMADHLVAGAVASLSVRHLRVRALPFEPPNG